MLGKSVSVTVTGDSMLCTRAGNTAPDWAPPGTPCYQIREKLLFLNVCKQKYPKEKKSGLTVIIYSATGSKNRGPNPAKF